jgi:hypothetical protein
MTEERLREIDNRAAATTPGPWNITCSGSYPVLMTRTGSDEAEASLADEEFINAAHADIPDLIAEVRRLSEEMDRVTQQRDAARAVAYQLYCAAPGEYYWGLEKDGLLEKHPWLNEEGGP